LPKVREGTEKIVDANNIKGGGERQEETKVGGKILHILKHA
jgi:hypothetical protein